MPWARPDSGFTVLFEALVMALAKEMAVAAIAETVSEHDTRIWRVIHHYVDQALEERDLSEVSRVGLDETSFKRGQSYVSIFADLDRSQAVFVTEGRGSSVVKRFAGELTAHGGSPEQIKEICQDMSKAYLKGSLEHLPEADITFDRYHVKAKLSEAVDRVRREEAGQRAETLKRSRYLWLSNPKNLSPGQRSHLDQLLSQPLNAARAYSWALRFDQLYELDGHEAADYLRRWVKGAVRSRLQPIIEFAHLVEDHWPGILAWFNSRASNGLLEGMNSMVQMAKRRARGYRSTRNYMAMIYLIAGKLEFGVTHAK